MQLSDLRALLELLRQFGVTEYEDGIRIKLGPVKSDQPATGTVPERPAKPVQSLHDAAATISPALAEAVSRLPAGYGDYFTGNVKSQP